eukprot:5577339-Prymnesium_polylepis.1
MNDETLLIGRRAPLALTLLRRLLLVARQRPSRPGAATPLLFCRDPEQCDIQIRLPEVSKVQAKLEADDEHQVRARAPRCPCTLAERANRLGRAGVARESEQDQPRGHAAQRGVGGSAHAAQRPRHHLHLRPPLPLRIRCGRRRAPSRRQCAALAAAPRSLLCARTARAGADEMMDATVAI